MKEAMYYKKGDHKELYCLLCPHYCKIQEGQIGQCRVRKNIDGRLYAMNYGKITSYAYDPIEKKPLYHFHPGREIFSLGGFGCNLACDFCQNWEIVHDENLIIDLGKDDVMSLARAKDSMGIAFTYNEPSIWFEYILDICKQARKEGLKTVMISNGYINEEPLRELLPYIDAMNIDLKSMEDVFYKTYCKGNLSPVLKAIEIAAQAIHVEITSLLIGEENTSMEEIEELSQWINRIDRSIPLHLTRYYPAYKMKLPATKEDKLIEARDLAKKYLDYVYIGNIWGTDNNTYCPQCHSRLINRHGGSKVTGIEDGKCKKCQYKINLIY